MWNGTFRLKKLKYFFFNLDLFFLIFGNRKAEESFDGSANFSSLFLKNTQSSISLNNICKARGKCDVGERFLQFLFI